MLFFILYVILVFFFAYCIVAPFLSLKFSNKRCYIYAVITVKNQEDSIEYTIRSIAKEMQHSDYINSIIPQELVVLDMNSQDRTYEILNKLSKEYPFIHPMSKSEYINIINRL